MALAYAIRLDATFTGLFAFIVGMVAFLTRFRRSTARQFLLAMLALLSTSLLMARAYYWVTWNPTGTIDDG